MTRFVSILAAVAVLLAAAPVASQTAPFEIDGLLPLTGLYAFNGRAELKSLEIIEAMVNRSGGIQGRPIKFNIADDQSKAEVSVQLTNALVAKKVPVIIGSSSSASCLAQAPVVKDGPLAYCLSPGIEPAKGSYQFSASLGIPALAAVMVRNFRLRGWTRIALITSTDASGQTFEQNFDRAMAEAENKPMVLTDREHFAPTDISVSAQLTRMKASNPQALFVWTSGTPFGTVLRGIKDLGIDLPIGAGNANMTYPQMEQYADYLPKQLFFPSQAGVGGVTGTGAWRQAQQRYYDAFRAQHSRPDFANAQGWDAAWLIVDAFRKLGPNATATQLHEYLAGLRGWAGVFGTYDFVTYPQRGTGEETGLMFTWNATRNDFVPASRPGGRV